MKFIMPLLLVLMLSQQLAIILQVVNKFKKINTYFFDVIEITSENSKTLLKGASINTGLLSSALIFYFVMLKVSAICILLFLIHIAYMKKQFKKDINKKTKLN
ncbi:MAG: hypothetical protein ACRC7R_00320 [Sarcina sp.]